MSSRCARLLLALCSGALVGTALPGCGQVGPAPGASVVTLPGGPATVTFRGIDYLGFGARMTMPEPTDQFALLIPADALAPFGDATRADPVLFPDRRVFAIRGVDPADAVVMFDRSSPQDIQMLVFTRGGVSPTIVAGLCAYYVNPAMHLCQISAPSPARTGHLSTHGSDGIGDAQRAYVWTAHVTLRNAD